MEWHDLLFMHWRVAPEQLRRFIPPVLTLETFDGAAWLGIVPFRMAGVRPRLAPALPWLSAFPELNVRTYVRAGDRPGVWFFSLDAANPVAVELARLMFHLNYVNANMGCRHDGDTVQYTSARHDGSGSLRARYRPAGPVACSAPGTLDHWLTERYCLYAANRRGDVWRGDIHHAPWPLQPAEAEIAENSMAQQIGVRLEGPPLLHFARRLNVRAWMPERVDA